MKNVPENELFSAYLDGELTAHEQAQVEQFLATSPAARQLVDELRALRVTLQSLPLHRLEEDISQRVLQLAQQQKATPRPNQQGRQDEAIQPAAWKHIFRRVLQPRTLIWPGMAVAAALLLMVMSEPQEPQAPFNQIAMHEGRAPGEVAVPEVAESVETDSSAGQYAEGAWLESPATEEPAKEFLDVHRALGDRPAAGAMGQTYGAQSEPGVAVDAVIGVPATAVEMRLPAKKGEDARASREVGSRPDSYGRHGEQVPKKAGFGSAGGDRFEAKRGLPEPAKPGGARPEQPSDEAKSRPATSDDIPALVVRCGISTETAQQRVLEKLLDEKLVARLDRLDQGEHTRGRYSAIGGFAGGAGTGSYGAMQKPPEKGKTEVRLEVEATSDQIKAIAADLKQRPEEFFALSYRLSPQVSSGDFAYWGFNESPDQMGQLAEQQGEMAAEPAAVRAPAHQADESLGLGPGRGLNEKDAPGSGIQARRRAVEPEAEIKAENRPKAEVEEAEEISPGESMQRRWSLTRQAQKAPDRDSIQGPMQPKGQTRGVQPGLPPPVMMQEQAPQAEPPRRKYRVLFVLQVVNQRPEVAASSARQSPPARSALAPFEQLIDAAEEAVMDAEAPAAEASQAEP